MQKQKFVLKFTAVPGKSQKTEKARGKNTSRPVSAESQTEFGRKIEDNKQKTRVK